MSEPFFCAGAPVETALYHLIEAHVLSRYPDVSVKHDRTQSAFIRKVQFAWLSMPRRKADAGAVMLSLGLPGPVDLPCMLHVAEVAPGRWMHHLLIRSADELNEEICSLIGSAWALVGCGRRG